MLLPLCPSKFIAMRIVHTADWHLGQTFYEHDRRAEHIVFIEWLLEQIKDKGVDLLLLSGDIFDSPNPSADAQHLFYDFLHKATTQNPNLQIIAIAGNHDSASRLEAPSQLLEAMNITVRGTITRTHDGKIDYNRLIIPLDKGGCCLAVPYLRQGDYPKADCYEEGVSKLYRELLQQVPSDTEPILAMGHLHVRGSQLNEGDRWEHISEIGGLECVSSDAFSEKIKYTALGHLHRNQKVGGRDNIRYSGTPLAMSFAERNNKQGVLLIDVNGNDTEINHIQFDKAVKLLRVPERPATIDKVMESIAALPDGEITSSSPYVEIQVEVTQPEPGLRHQIETALEGKAVRLARMTSTMAKADTELKDQFVLKSLHDISVLDMTTDIWKLRNNGNAMPNELKELLNGIIDEVTR